MNVLRRVSVLGVGFVALALPLAAGARPPEPSGPLTPLPSAFVPRPPVFDPHLVVSRLSSMPVHVRRGAAYVVSGRIVNEGGAAARGRVVVHLVRVGSRPLAIGDTAVGLAAHDSSAY